VAADPVDLSTLAEDPRALAGFLPGLQPGVRMRVRWSPGANAEEGAWLLDFYEDDGTILLAGIRAVVSEDLWAAHRVTRDALSRALRLKLAAGVTSADPGLRDLGAAVQVEVVDLA
jgi:hypothetical protein